MRPFFAILALLLVAACGSGDGWTPPVYSGKQESTEGVPGFDKGRKTSPYVKLGQSYKVMGEWYVPRFQPDYNETGMASWYGPGFHGGKTANGEAFDKHSMTAAHKTLPLPSIVKVTMVDTGKTTYVRINDRGPFSKGRIIDLSYAAAKEIGLIQKGVAKVKVEYKLAESQRFADLLAQGRDPEDIDIASEVLPYANDNVNVASREIKQKASRASNDPSWWDGVNPVSSAHAGTPPDPLYTGSIPTAAPTQQVASADLAPPVAAAPKKVHQASPFDAMTQEEAWSPPPQQAARVMEPPPSVPPPVGGHYVQLGTFGVEANARRLQSRLSDLGSVQVAPAQVGDATLYRVRMGPYENTDMAEEMLSRVQQMGIDARLMKN